MEDENLHIGLWTFSKNFFRGGRVLMNDAEIHLHGVAYYLHCHAIELALKALLTHRGYTETHLRRIGHDLEKAWKTALKNGLGNFLTDLADIELIIRSLNMYYKTKQFEYIRPGAKRYPLLEELHAVTARLIYAVGHAIEIPPPHLFQFHQEIILEIETP